MQERFRRLMEDAKLSRFTDDILNLAMNSVRIKLQVNIDAEKLPPGASKIGGIPDLPPAREWPSHKCDPSYGLQTEAHGNKGPSILSRIRCWLGSEKVVSEDESSSSTEKLNQPLAFVAQMNMNDVAPYDVDGLLPHSGMLYFFFDSENLIYSDYGPGEFGGHRVLYYDGDISLIQPTDPPGILSHDEVYPAYSVAFSQEVTLPGTESQYLRKLGMSWDEQREYAEIRERLFPVGEDGVENSVHRMLGHADNLQHDAHTNFPFEKERYDSPDIGTPVTQLDKSVGWRLLLQIDSVIPHYDGTFEPFMNWGDAGKLYYFIKARDLDARDFSRVEFEMQYW